jgi:ferredoxin
MRVEVERETCVSAGMCVLSAPDWFDQDEDDGRVVVHHQAEGPDDAVEQAVELCPSGAIRLR